MSLIRNRVFFHAIGTGTGAFRGVSVMNADGTKRENLGEGISPAISPNGHHIAICLDHSRAIGLMNADGTDLQIVHNCTFLHTELTFYPDGSRVVFVEWPDDRGAGRIVSLDLKTSRIEPVPEIR